MITTICGNISITTTIAKDYGEVAGIRGITIVVTYDHVAWLLSTSAPEKALGLVRLIFGSARR